MLAVKLKPKTTPSVAGEVRVFFFKSYFDFVSFEFFSKSLNRPCLSNYECLEGDVRIVIPKTHSHKHTANFIGFTI